MYSVNPWRGFGWASLVCQVEMLEMYSIVQTVHNEPREGRRWTGLVCQLEMYSIVQNLLYEPREGRKVVWSS